MSTGSGKVQEREQDRKGQNKETEENTGYIDWIIWGFDQS